MPGFDPVGSVPVASIGGGTSGTTITPIVGAVVISGFTPVLSGTDPVQVHSVNREVLRDDTGTVRVSAVFREVLRDPELVYVYSHSVVREVLRDGFPLSAQGGSVSILW